jgi:very-short-patch-repair endonuclease
MSVKFNNDDFIRESIKIHGDKYDYSLVNYTKSTDKVIINCKIHGPFEQRSSNHLRGRGCYNCKKTRKYDSNKFILLSKEIHGDKYLYGNTIYNGSHSDVIITCKIHGDFNQSPTNHLRDKGCNLCAKESTRLDIYNFINRCNLTHNNLYDYSLVEYKNLREKISINCKIHGEFWQRAKNHLDGQGCPKCGDNFGIKENKWLDSLNISERQVRIGRYVVDGYDPETKTVYEFNGDFWHGNPKVHDPNQINRIINKTFKQLHEETLRKEQDLKDNGYTVVSIWESDWRSMSTQWCAVSHAGRG